MSSQAGSDKTTIDAFNPDLKSVLEERAEGHYLFIVADIKKATLFLLNQGMLEDTRDIMDPSVNKKIKSNSGEMFGRSSKYDHKINNQIQKHLKLIAGEASKLVFKKHVNGVFIGGHKDQFNSIKEALPHDLQEKVRGEFVTELNIPHEELFKHCENALSEYLKNY